MQYLERMYCLVMMIVYHRQQLYAVTTEKLPSKKRIGTRLRVEAMVSNEGACVEAASPKENATMLLLFN